MDFTIPTYHNLKIKVKRQIHRPCQRRKNPVKSEGYGDANCCSNPLNDHQRLGKNWRNWKYEQEMEPSWPQQKDWQRFSKESLRPEVTCCRSDSREKHKLNLIWKNSKGMKLLLLLLLLTNNKKKKKKKKKKNNNDE